MILSDSLSFGGSVWREVAVYGGEGCSHDGFSSTKLFQ